MITAIVLAAGMSSRLGTLKQLLDFQGRPLIRHVVETIVNSQVQDVLVVLGSKFQEVSEVLKGLPIRTVMNQDYADGQSTSVKKGVTDLIDVSALNDAPLPEGVLFALGDQPLLRTETVNLLINRFDSYGGIVVPSYKGTRGNPVIFERKFLPEFQLLSGDTGAKEIIRRYAEEVHMVEVDDVGVIFDIDTWEDFRKLQMKE